MNVLANVDRRELLYQGRELLEREAALLDDQRWDDWLTLYTEDCEYWMPAWCTEQELTVDPRAQLSHFYYADRAGLEERLVRIRSGRSPASTPIPRTTHMLGSVVPRGPITPQRQLLRASWVCHVHFIRSHDSHAFFGRSEIDLVRSDDEWRIARKKIVLQNDYLRTTLDIYCV